MLKVSPVRRGIAKAGRCSCRAAIVRTMAMAGADEAWHSNLVRDPAQIQRIALEAKTVAVLGIKTNQQSAQPAYYVPQYLLASGVKVIPVPVFYPDVVEILGQQVFRKLADVPGPIDIVNVFRKSSDIPPHLPDILAARPKAVWLQSGITNPEAEEELARAGIQVVSNRCLMVEHRLAASGALPTSHL